jgi:hypothetical protein
LVRTHATLFVLGIPVVRNDGNRPFAKYPFRSL